MNSISIDECDLLDFFGSDHVSRQFGDAWFDSDSLYKHEQPDGLTVTCAVHPIHKDARITLSLRGVVHYDWQATALADICFERENKCLAFTTQTGDKLTLTLAPRILILLNGVYREA